MRHLKRVDCRRRVKSSKRNLALFIFWTSSLNSWKFRPCSKHSKFSDFQSIPRELRYSVLASLEPRLLHSQSIAANSQRKTPVVVISVICCGFDTPPQIESSNYFFLTYYLHSTILFGCLLYVFYVWGGSGHFLLEKNNVALSLNGGERGHL